MKQNYRKPWRWSQGVQKAGLAALLFFGAVKGVDAQVSAYSFSQSSGTFTEVTGGTVLAAATGNSIGAPSLDSGTWGISLPFTFNFNGLNHTALNVSANGFVTFGTTTTTTSSPISGSEAYQGAISAFGRDLNTVFNVSGVTGDIRWETVGTAPNREVVIQWTNFRPTYSTSATAAYVFSFQIRLQESTNQISTVYTQGAYLLGSSTYSGTAQIGLRGATNTDFNNRLNSTTELFANSNTGTANGSSQAFNTVNATPGMPSDGLTYTWTPPICIGSVGVLGAATTNTIPVTWTASPSAVSGYTIYYSTVNTAPTASTVLDATNSVAAGAAATSADITGLTASTTYYIWMRTECGATDVSGWVSLGSVTTACSVFTAPWTYNVETGTATTNASIGDCWTATPTATSSAFRWDLDDNGSTPSSSTGPSAAYSGTKYFYTEASSGGTGAVAELLSPFVDVSALTEPSVQFYYHMYGSTMGELHVDVYDGAAWNNDLFVLTGQQQTAAADAWRLAIVDLSSLTITGNIQVRFRALRGTDFYGDMAIDDIAFVEAPACIAPSGLTAATTPADATITWNASSSNPSSYDVYVDTTNTQPATPTYPGVTGTSQVIPGVSGTTYYVWVVANCATATAVAGPISYTIPFPPPANDECTGAITLTVNPDLSCGVVTQATTVSATQSTGVPNPTCGVLSGTDDDVWFKFTATGNAHRISLTSISGSSDRVMQLYSGACGSLVTVQCSDPETMDVTTLTPGQEYYVRVWTYATSATTSSTFNICVGTPPPPPVNDDCGGAIALPGGVDFVSGAVVGTNVAATNSPQTVASCSSNSGMDVWYTVTIPSSGNVTLETKAVTGSSYTDSVISAYTGDCTTGLTQIPGAAGCNDDDGDGNFSLLNVTGQTPGSVLYVRVSRYAATGSNAGEFQVSAYDPSFLGTSEVITDSKEVKVYPNPFTDIVNVSDIKDVKRVTVVDMAGRVVKTISNPERALQLGDLKSGMYILKLDYKDGTVKSAKVIKK